MDIDVWTSLFLIRNGSLVLKGVPGTGKTQLIEMSTMLFANDVLDVDDDEERALKKKDGTLVINDVIGDNANRENMIDWLTNRGILGMASHNSDKELQDVFYSTRVEVEKYEKKKDVEEGKDDEPSEPDDIGEPTPSPTPVPKPDGDAEPQPGETPDVVDGKDNPELTSKQKEDYSIPPRNIELYDITPEPRTIITSMIKFQNEANRMNKDVADALLSILAEREIELQGKVFYSPTMWDKDKGYIYERKGFGQLSFFDYNPHLEVEFPDMELDRALLDRITAGFFLSSGTTSGRFTVMGKKLQDKETEPREIIYDMIKNREISPLTRFETETAWKLLPLVPADAEVLAWITWLTNIPNLTNRRYGDLYATEIQGKPIDKSIVTFAKALQHFKSWSLDPGELDADLQLMLDDMQRPMGFRCANSMYDLMRAQTILGIIKERGDLRDAELYIKNDADRERIFNKLLETLPYILDHRLNLGVGNFIQQNFLSTFDMLKYYMTARINDNREALFGMMDAIMYQYSDSTKRKLEGGSPLGTQTKRNKIAERTQKNWDDAGVGLVLDDVLKNNSLLYSLFELGGAV